MRALLFLAGSSLAVTACGDQTATEADANVAANFASETIFANDTTVIDAATGDASNMAADVAYTENSLEPGGDVRADGTTVTESAPRQQPRRTAPATTNAAEPPAPSESATDGNSL